MMANSPRPRHLLLGIALLATLAATIWVGQREPENDVVSVPNQRDSLPPAPIPSSDKPTAGAEQQLSTPLPRSANEGEIVNLFPKQSWYVAPPPPAPSAPPLPFSYLGKYSDGNEVVVFVSSGEQNFVVHQGDIVNGNYRIDEIAPPTMTITYLPLNQKQTLEIGRAK